MLTYPPPRDARQVLATAFLTRFSRCRQVWKLHKRVCGQNPFYFPALTDAEANKIWEMRHKVFELEVENSPPRSIMQTSLDCRWRPALSSEMLTKSEDVIFKVSSTLRLERSAMFDTRLSKAMLDTANEPVSYSWPANYFIIDLRTSTYSAKMIEVKNRSRSLGSLRQNARSLALDDPLGCMAWAISRAVSSLFTDPTMSGPSCWQSTFLHRLSMFIARVMRLEFPSIQLVPTTAFPPDDCESLDHMIHACRVLDTSLTPIPTLLDRVHVDKILDLVTLFLGVSPTSLWPPLLRS